MLARLIAVAIHEVREELRRLDAASAPASPPEKNGEEQQRYDLRSVTSLNTERAASWDHDKRTPVTAARFGFRPPGDR